MLTADVQRCSRSVVTLMICTTLPTGSQPELRTFPVLCHCTHVCCVSLRFTQTVRRLPLCIYRAHTDTHTHCEYKQSAVRKWAVRYFALWLSQDRLAVIITLQVSVKDGTKSHLILWRHSKAIFSPRERKRIIPNWSSEQTALRHLFSCFCHCLFCFSHCSITSWDVAIWGKCYLV